MAIATYNTIRATQNQISTANEAPPSHYDKSYSVTKPESAVLYHQLGTVFPSINSGHIRIEIEVTTLDNVTTDVCNMADMIQRMKNYLTDDDLLPSSLKASYQGMTDNNKTNTTFG